MSIFHKLNTFTQNCENKLLITQLCNKFIIRNKIDSSTYIVENGIFFFALDIKQLKKLKKNFRKKKRIKYYTFLFKNKKQKFFERLSTFVALKKNSNLKTKKFKSKKILELKEQTFKKKFNRRFYKNFKGHSIKGDIGLFKFKRKFRPKLFLFFKKKKKLNFLKHRLFLIKLILKLKKNKIPFSGFIKKSKKGGYLCKSIIFSIRAFLPKSHIIQPLKKNFKKLFFKLFKILKISSYNEVIKAYIIFCYIKKRNFKSFNLIISKYKNKILFPLYIGSFKKKISKIKQKKVIKFLYRLKRKKRRFFLKKKKYKLFRKKKKFRKCFYDIIFISNFSNELKSFFQKKKISFSFLEKQKNIDINKNYDVKKR